MKNIVIIIFIVFLFSCNKHGSFVLQNCTEGGVELAVWHSDTTIKYIWPNDSSYIRYPNGMFIIYHRHNNIDTVFIWKEAPIINAHIWNTKADDIYITVDQKPYDLIFGEISKKGSRLYRPSNTGKAERMLKESKIHRYWIINKNTNNVYGGYEKDEFLMMCDSLNVPHKLRFQMKIK